MRVAIQSVKWWFFGPFQLGSVGGIFPFSAAFFHLSCGALIGYRCSPCRTLFSEELAVWLAKVSSVSRVYPCDMLVPRYAIWFGVSHLL